MATSYQHSSLLFQQENLQLPKRKVGVVQPLGITGKGLIGGPIGNDVKIFKKKAFEGGDLRRPLGDVNSHVPGLLKPGEKASQKPPVLKQKFSQDIGQLEILKPKPGQLEILKPKPALKPPALKPPSVSEIVATLDGEHETPGLLKPGEKASQKPPVLKQKFSQDIGQLEILKPKPGQLEILKPKPALKPPALKPPSVSEIVATLDGEHETPLVCLEVDVEDREDPFYCTDYVEDVYQFLKESEQKPVYVISTHFLSNQSKVTSHHRCVLIDWLVQVQRKFKLLQETLYITIDILDRYLDVSWITCTC